MRLLFSITRTVKTNVIAFLLSTTIISLCHAAFNSHITLDAPFNHNFLAALHGNATSYPSENATTDVFIDPSYNITFSEAMAVSSDGFGGVYVAGNLELETSYSAEHGFNQPDETKAAPKAGVMTDTAGDIYYRLDIFVARVLSTGELAWIKRMGTFGDDTATDIVADDQGFAYVTAHLSHGLADGTKGGVLFKLRPSDGERVWAKSYDTRNGREHLLTLAVVPKRGSRAGVTNISTGNSTMLVISGTASASSELAPGGGAMLLLVNASDGQLITFTGSPPMADSTRTTISSLTLQRVRKRVVKNGDMAFTQRQTNNDTQPDNDTQDAPSNDTQGTPSNGSSNEPDLTYIDSDEVMVNGCGFVNIDGKLNAALFSFMLVPSSDDDDQTLQFQGLGGQVVEYRQNEYFSGAATSMNGRSVYCAGTKTISSYEERDGRVMRFNTSFDHTRGWVTSIGSKRFPTLFEAEQNSGTANEEGRTISVDEHGNLYVLLRSTSRLAVFDHLKNEEDKRNNSSATITTPSRSDSSRHAGASTRRRRFKKSSRSSQPVLMSSSSSSSKQETSPTNNANSTTNSSESTAEGDDSDNDELEYDRPALIVMAPDGSVVDAMQARTPQALTVNTMVRLGSVMVIAGKSGDSQAVLTAAIFPDSIVRPYADEFLPETPSASPKAEAQQVSQAEPTSEEKPAALWIIIASTIGGVLFAVLTVSIACVITRNAVRRAKGIDPA